MAAYSFRGTAFDVERSGIWESGLPEPETVEDRAKIPLSNVTIVDDGGDGLAVWTPTMIVLAADVAAMKANRRQIGSLVTPTRTYSNAKLSQIRSVAESIDGDYFQIQAEFILA